MATTYLTRTPGGAGNRKTFTFSAWVKRGNMGATTPLFVAGSSSSIADTLFFDSADVLQIEGYNSGIDYKFATNRVFRDPAAWYHIVLKIDTTQSTDTDRMKLYVNGVDELSTGGYSSITYPAEDYEGSINNTVTQTVGSSALATRFGTTYFSGVMAHVHLTDGTAYAPTAFGETDSTSGNWVPISAPSLTYGDNGLFLKFSKGAFGTDSSGNSNTMTVSGTMTATKDNAMNNFATMNSQDNYRPGVTFSNGNTTIVTPASSLYSPTTSTIGVTSGKWYWEVKPTTMVTYNEQLVGIASSIQISNTAQLGYYPNDWGYYANNGNSYNNNVSTSYGDAYVVNDIIGVALDLTNNKLYFAKNNTWQNSGVPTSGATGTGALSITAVGSTPLGVYLPAATYWHSSSNTYSVNYGNGYFGTTAVTSAEADGNGEGQFEYAPPTGYFALCTNNLGSES